MSNTVSESYSMFEGLPNKESLDRVFSLFFRYPRIWDRYKFGSDEGRWYRLSTKLTDNFNTTSQISWDQVYRYVKDKQREEDSTVSSWFSFAGAVIALLSYDDCAYMLDSDPTELELLSKLGDDKAFLMIPACRALKEVMLVIDSNI